MAFPRKLLAPGERVVLEAHPNWSILLFRLSLAFLVVAGSVAVVVSWPSAPLWVGYVLLGLGAIALLAVLAKVVTWRSTTIVITNGRVVYRTGALRRLGREIPLNRVQDVTYRQNLLERMLGAGSLTIESAGKSGLEALPDIARPAMVQSLINSLMFTSGSGPGTAGGWGWGEPDGDGASGYGRAAGGHRDTATYSGHTEGPLDATRYGRAAAGYREGGAGRDWSAPPGRAPASGEPTAEYQRTPAFGQPAPHDYDFNGPRGSGASTSRPRQDEDPDEAGHPPTVLPTRWVRATRDDPPTASPEETGSTNEELARLLELHRLGVITDAELADKRRELFRGP